MSREIRALDAETRDRIAAGEVVERPASAVKELVENALDADASRVDVTVSEGGIEGILVADDGIGMDREAAKRAIQEHTTSKIRDIEDLESGVATLGFRGEALHAITSVSRTTITTRPRSDAASDDESTGTVAETSEEDDDGTELVVEGGEVTDVRPAGRPPGTTVEVEDLFYNVPARRKFLKQPSTEFAHVNTVVARYALANPDVAVSLTHDDREIFATTGRGDLQETILSVYGREVARSMIAVGDRAEDAELDLPEGPLTGISGMVSHPETNRAGREYLATYVNGRSVRSATVREAIVEAYGTQLAPDRYPFAVLFLEVDPATVDVNVHPRKREVRFADSEGVRTQVKEAVESALLREGLIRSSAPRGRSAPEQTEVSPERGAETSGDDEGGSSSTDRSRSTRATELGDQSEGTNITSIDRSGDEASKSQAASPAWSDTDEADGVESPTAEDWSTWAHAHDQQRRFRGGDEQSRLTEEEPEQSFDRLPSMTILGQYRETYVVAETDDGLIVIDQHAADERINYERLREKFASDTTTQSLAEPVSVELTAREAAVFDDRADGLAELGFHAERVDDRTVQVTAVPGLLAGDVGPELIRDLLSAYVESETSADATVQSAADHLLGDLACYPSITANTSLAEGSIRELLSALDDCENPYACPHGRPVIVSISAAELEDRFERDYPGHQGRRE